MTAHFTAQQGGFGFEQALNSYTGVHGFYFSVRLRNLFFVTKMKNTFNVSEVHSTGSSSIFFSQSLKEQ